MVIWMSWDETTCIVMSSWHFLVNFLEFECIFNESSELFHLKIDTWGVVIVQLQKGF